jgi:hypothetical protein
MRVTRGQKVLVALTAVVLNSASTELHEHDLRIGDGGGVRQSAEGANAAIISSMTIGSFMMGAMVALGMVALGMVALGMVALDMVAP